MKYSVDNCVKIMIKFIDKVDEPKSRAAVIWMLGEYSEKIKGSIELLEEVSKTFKESNIIV